MKTFTFALLLAVLVAAEPPRYEVQRFARFRVQKEELRERPEEGAKEHREEAPYAAAGFKPSEEFNLPSRHEVSPSFKAPENSYDAPFKIYTHPRVAYGIPERREGNERSEGERKEEKGEEREGGESEHFREGNRRKENLEEERKGESEVEHAHGAYYVLLPHPQLEKVQYQTENDLRNMAYTARLQYRSEERSPLFFYSPAPQYQSAAYVQLI